MQSYVALTSELTKTASINKLKVLFLFQMDDTALWSLAVNWTPKPALGRGIQVDTFRCISVDSHSLMSQGLVNFKNNREMLTAKCVVSVALISRLCKRCLWRSRSETFDVVCWRSKYFACKSSNEPSFRDANRTSSTQLTDMYGKRLSWYLVSVQIRFLVGLARLIVEQAGAAGQDQDSAYPLQMFEQTHQNATTQSLRTK